MRVVVAETSGPDLLFAFRRSSHARMVVATPVYDSQHDLCVCIRCLDGDTVGIREVVVGADRVSLSKRFPLRSALSHLIQTAKKVALRGGK